MATREEWKKENTVQIPLRLNKHTDADLIEHLAGCASRMGEIKRLMRIAIEYEKSLENK